MPQPTADDVKRLFNAEYEAYRAYIGAMDPFGGEFDYDRTAAIKALQSMDQPQLELLLGWVVHPLSGFLPKNLNVKQIPEALQPVFEKALDASYQHREYNDQSKNRTVLIASRIVEDFYQQKAPPGRAL